ncbi:MAG: HmuY family protein [Capnocytophaga sp.]|nr:HmuY family protein [Capnocytophaga sp.]
MRIKLFLSLILGVFILASCNKDNSTEEQPKETIDLSFTDEKEITFDVSSGTATWTYISLADGKVVTPTTPATDLSWDIAFNRYFVITNGGVSGAGKAAVATPTGTDFTAVTQAFTDASKYTKDAETEVTVRGATVKLNISPILSGGFGTQTGIINISPTNIALYGGTNVYNTTGNVYVMKTADGTYAKIQVTDIYNVTEATDGTKTYTFGKFKLKYRLTINKSE